MLDLKGYKFGEKIYETQRTLVYTGKRLSDDLPVMIKILALTSPSAQEIERFEYEYKIGSALKIPVVPEYYALENYGSSRLIVFEAVSGMPLDRVLKDGPMDLKDFLAAALEMSKALGEIHRNQVIHKDIKPQNIIYNRTTSRVKFIDFSIASRVRKEVKDAVNPNRLEGTLSYISPEQTGRMNRSVDFRTDYYSLGITFFQMLTGKLPFTGNDAMEIVYAHMAVKPRPVNEIVATIPAPVSDIVMKLMAKTAEERYQSSEGLTADLQECLDRLERTGRIDAFPLGGKDVSGIFQIPEKLYGRDRETKLLFEEFEKISDGRSGVVFFAGISGSGKSFLINELQKPLVRQRGYFVSGKFDQFKRSIPFSAMIQAFQELIRQILTESREKVEVWKNALLKALGENGQLVIEVVPELELIIGKQPEIARLEAAEAQNRFNYVFQNFIRVFTQKEHPLVLFLDDLQWADDASLRWLDMTLKDQKMGYFLFIGSYRNNEVGAGHPLNNIFENLKRQNADWKTIELEPLATDCINRMVCDTMQIGSDRAGELASIVKTKTTGNPLFVIEYLKTLYDQEYIVFANGWNWDTGKIQTAKMPDNVVDFMAEKIRKLPEETLKILKSASCMGVRIQMNAFMKICGLDSDTILNLFKPAIDEGMLIKQEDKFLFAHDRIQEAVYSLLDDKSRKATHYEIGKELARHATPEEMEDILFTVVYQLNLGSSLISSESERLELAKMNFRAAKKAKASTAYDAAEEYLKAAEGLLPEDPWNNAYELALSVSTELSEIYYLINNKEKMNGYFQLVLKSARNILDKIRIYELKVIYYLSVMDFPAGFDAAMEGFRLLGVNIPRKASMLRVMLELVSWNILLGSRTIESLENLPMMTDQKQLAAVRLIMAFILVAYFAYPKHTPIAVFTINKLSLQYGNSYYSSFAYATLGTIITNVLIDPKKGNRYARLGLRIFEKYHDNALKARMLFSYHQLNHHWESPLKETLPYLIEAYRSGVENGDFPFASYSLNNYIINQVYCGSNLNLIRQSFEKYGEEYKKLDGEYLYLMILMHVQFVENLTTGVENRTKLTGKYSDEDRNMKVFIENNTMLADVYPLKSLLSYIFGEYEDCVTFGKLNEPHLGSILGMSMVLAHFFHYTIGLLAHYRYAKPGKKRAYMKTIVKYQKRLKFWAECAPSNTEHKYLFTEAERRRLFPKKYRINEIISLYDRAIRLAHQNEFTHEEAIINERAGRYCLELEMPNAANTYIAAAFNCYVSWGAIVKARELQKEFPEYIVKESRNSPSFVGRNRFAETTLAKTAPSVHSITVESSSSTQSQLMDISTIMKASETISGEIVTGKLYGRLLKILMENVGADKSLLILAKQDDVFLEAEAVADRDDFVLFNSAPIPGSGRIPESIVNYVVRTKKNIVLKDAAAEGEYAKDPYILDHQPKSVLCAPIMNQSKLTGLIYLENSLVPGTFTPDRLQVLKILGGQIGISLDNAELYEQLEEYSKTLEQKVEMRTTELNQAVQVLREKQNLIARELNVAKRVQLTLVPQVRKLPHIDGLEFGAHYVPMEDIGGDMYDVIEIDENTVGFLIADVSGHGVPSALITTMLKAMYSYTAKPGKSASRIATEINEEMVKMIGDLEHFFSAVFGIYDRKTGRFVFSNGGHYPALHYRVATGDLVRLEVEGPIMGKFPGEKYGQKETVLKPGDGVLFYTDGIIDARNSAEEFYGINRLQELFRSAGALSAAEVVKVLMDDLEIYCEGTPADDDRTILYVRVSPK